MQRNPNLSKAPRASAFPSPVIVEWMRSRVAAAGGDPATVPDMPYRFVRPAEAAKLCGLHVATLYRMVEDGTLPAPIPVDRGLPLKKSAPSAA